MFIHNTKVPDWDQHFNKRTTFRPGMIGAINAFNKEYEDEHFAKKGILNDHFV